MPSVLYNLPRIPLMRAQNDLLRLPPPGCGGFKFAPVSRLYFERPADVSPPLWDRCIPILRYTILSNGPENLNVDLVRFRGDLVRFLCVKIDMVGC